LISGGEKIPSSKLEALKDLVDELLQNGHKALIFSQFVDYLRMLSDVDVAQSDFANFLAY
jgi:SNF2 family DNA or RNA helicase